MPKSVSNAQIEAIPGWFQEYDVDMFRLLLERTAEAGGDLAELGAYLGKSAVLIGSSLAPDERFTVIDLFGSEAGEEANRAENADQYLGLTREDFEQNYRRVHGELPDVVVGLSASVVDHARRGTHRFVHVDAGHLYDNVVEDIDAARTLLKPDGVVVFDDYRTEHTPGVSAAVWRSTAEGLRPFAVTPVKLYATFGDPQPWFDAVQEWVGASRWKHEVQSVAGNDIVRLWWEAERTTALPLRNGLRERAVRKLRRLRG
ncbi:class I SAM-dependent methyltransferase [Nocardioides zhouii]|uniref:class I SAM-dependent methyltransferase n=1 Tax=Nocardioides zhouii TaxID=1168729 RepID=UPI001A93148C|nr:class I SAM-dependent methyltransferase [Nocardioides zhouii]